MRRSYKPIIVLVCLAVIAFVVNSVDAERRPANFQPTSVKASGLSQTSAEAEFKRLVRLRTALGKIPADKINREPHKSFIKANKKDIVYSEPAGEWYVRSDLFWKLSKKYKKLPIADDIAWAAAENPLPGECEGYINCYIYTARSTYGQYLNLYPDGKHSKKALLAVAERLNYIVEDLNAKKGNYEGPVDANDRAELAKTIGELRAILSGVSNSERSKVLSQINLIGETFK